MAQRNGDSGTAGRPESLLISLFGLYALERAAALSTGGIIDVMSRLGVGEHATRTTLSRMTRRGLLASVRQGRRAYLGLTGYGHDVLTDGQQRITTEVVNRDWDGQWTVLGFSIPESRRTDRHALRRQLAWAGFGLLQNGLWIAPSPADISPVLEEMNLLDHVRIFRANAVPPTRPADLIREAWDLDQLADGYTAFLRRWDENELAHLDPMCRQIRLHTEWLLLIRTDPRLPLDLLPDGWPGVRAEELFWKLRQKLHEPARQIVEAAVDRIPLPEPDKRTGSR